MSKVSMQYTYVAKRDTSGNTVAYKDKMLFGRGGIKADIKFTTASGSIWEAGVEHDKVVQVTGGTCDYETGVLQDDVICYVLGHKKDDTTSVITYNADDVAPELGMCFIATLYNDGVYSYRGVFLKRVKFNEPDESYETAKGDINLSTYTLSSSIMLDESRNYKEAKTFATLAEAKTWCDEFFTSSDTTSSGTE